MKNCIKRYLKCNLKKNSVLSSFFKSREKKLKSYKLHEDLR